MYRIGHYGVALLVWAPVGFLLLRLGRPAGPSLAAFCFGVGALAVLGHLLGDALTPAGVCPLWPLSRRRYTLALATADSRVANYLLLALGLFAAAAAALAAAGPA